jgi:small neutral amino acid transporter SnatA (MarC family)
MDRLSTVPLLLALTIAWALSGAILLSSTFLYRVLRERGLMAMERLMSMLLVMVAVQMLLNGLKVFLLGQWQAAERSSANGL